MAMKSPVEQAEAAVLALNIFVDLLINADPAKRVSAQDTGRVFVPLLDGLKDSLSAIKGDGSVVKLRLILDQYERYAHER